MVTLETTACETCSDCHSVDVLGTTVTDVGVPHVMRWDTGALAVLLGEAAVAFGVLD